MTMVDSQQQEEEDKEMYPLLLDRLEENASKYPQKTVFTFLSPGLNGGRISASLTYRQLQQQSSTLATRLLLQSGLSTGDRVLLVYPPSLDYSVAFLACLKAGIVAVPVFPPLPSRRDTLKMFAVITNSCQAKFALTNQEYSHIKKISSVKDAIATKVKFSTNNNNNNNNNTPTWPDHLTWIVTDDKTHNNNNNNNNKAVTTKQQQQRHQPSDLAFLQYTSGSTSEPKGVMITHGNLAHNLTIITNELQAKEDTVVVSWLPQYHDMGLIGSYLGVLYCGGSGYYTSPLTFLQRPMLWIEAVSKFNGTHLQAPNFAFKLTARKFQPSEYVNRPLQLRSVRHIINAAEPVDQDAITTFYNAFSPFGLSNVIYPTYGLAEHTVFVCSSGKQILKLWKEKLQTEGVVEIVNNDVDDDTKTTTTTTTTTVVDNPESVSILVGCGYPSHQQVDVRIVDRDTCRELSAGRVGEIWINSPSKAAGYFGKPNETQEDFHAKIRNDSTVNDKTTMSSTATYLRTGDLGFFHNNELFICGRIKDLIIVAGRNYYPQDFEATAEAVSDLLRPGCSAAFTIDSTHQGGEEVALVMELRDVPPSKAEINKICEPLADQVRSAVNQEHSLGISQILFLKTKTVPKTSSGKIARAWCRKGYLAGTLQVVYEKSFPKFNDGSTSLEMEGSDTVGPSMALKTPVMTQEAINELRSMSRDEIMDKLRLDVARTAQLPPDSIDNDTALVTILDSMSISQFKGRLEGAYSCKISDEYLFGETVTLKKLADVVKLGFAPDDTGDDAAGDGRVAAAAASSSMPTGKAEGLAGVLGCPPGVKVCCVIQ
ncbi:acyl-CoA synthetase AMP-forming/AMP-acid ligase II [Nitzschia inconspicua]|uniref:Acyl-CoA synthetase AMP-forming/AMP-acid ligase II n=1 Tax=Nitzschia inconspicua TaxID=303405 RepID=A0A9K3KFY6_9STRA|nr:acyl-CoA synthetase AMP-forming/AMP-acid ligase II [Nitzschia inconspicua]KAG7371692.1 acyl-CoA synthetase AMP-forming/AMP-acid ligase II [Nitzschia inconspicua]